MWLLARAFGIRLPLLPFLLIFVVAGTMLTVGCGGRKQSRRTLPPPPPPIAQPDHDADEDTVATAKPPRAAPQTRTPGEPAVDPGIDYDPDAVPIFTETGKASWYGTVYHNRKAANGEIFDMNALTAAHRTLPLNSIVRVTNTKTGSVAVLRITDRGPFVTDRVIDLSMGAAKVLDVWRPGTALVKIEVLKAPKDLEEGGRWCVQIGSIKDQEIAAELKDRLVRRYRTAQVLKFSGPMHDWWVRVRVPGDDKRKAEEVARDNSTPEGAVYLVRLD
jgi:rare lipoprotein A